MKNNKTRLLDNIIVTDTGCWEWQKYKRPNGYSTFSINNKKLLAHRASYILFNGLIPRGLLVCHKCDKRDCVNPAHLFLGTHKDNMQDMLSKGRASRVSRSVGSKHGQAILSEDEVLSIRLSFSAEKHTVSDLARLYKVNYNVIDRVVKRKTWRHI